MLFVTLNIISFSHLGGILESEDQSEEAMVTKLDQLMNTNDMLKWIEGFLLFLEDGDVLVENSSYKNRIVCSLEHFKISLQCGAVISKEQWLDQDSVSVLSAYVKVPYTLFEFTDTDLDNGTSRKWAHAFIAGDGQNPSAYNKTKQFTHKQCLERIIQTPRFCVLSNGHFYPIATHTLDLNNDYIEAIKNLSASLFNVISLIKKKRKYTESGIDVT